MTGSPNRSASRTSAPTLAISCGWSALPTVIVPPVIDDFGRINRVSWYGIFDFHLLRDAHVEAYITAASTADHS